MIYLLACGCGGAGELGLAWILSGIAGVVAGWLGYRKVKGKWFTFEKTNSKEG